MTPYHARWVLALAFSKAQGMNEMLVQIEKYEGDPRAEQKKQQLEEAKKRLDWAMDRATEVIVKEQVKS